MTWAELLEWGASELRAAGVEDAELNAEYLALHTMGLWHRQQLRDRLRESAKQEPEFRELLGRRATREPLQYIIGEWEFFGLRLYTSPEALIPRPETEILVEEALKEAAAFERPTVLDIGTGSGAIALAVASRLPYSDVIGIDISEPALALSERNRARLGLSNVTFVKVDILREDLREYTGRIDLLVSNPPYVSASEYSTIEPELEHEPRLAITDEGTGLTFYTRILERAPDLLSPRGVLLFELGYDVADAVQEIVVNSGMNVLRIVRDLNGIDRVLVAVRSEV